MISKITTIIYLISLLSVLWMTYRHQLRPDDDLMLKKILTVLFSGYSLAVIFIYSNTFDWAKPALFFSMLSFCPFIWSLFVILKKYNYEGDLGILLLAIMLNSLGLVILYRLDIGSSWFLTKALHVDAPVPMAFKQLVYSLIALFGFVMGVVGGIFRKILKGIGDSKYIMVWGVIAFAVLALPKLFGFSMWLTQGKSLQPSEFAFKILFLIFISKYYANKSSELFLPHYPFKEVLKLVLFIFSGIALFFYFPLVFMQKELGTALLIALTFIILTSYVTGRFSIFLAGLVIIALTIWGGVFVSPHIEKRVIGAWLDWKDFAFKSFREGEKIYPGYQAFTALCAIRLSPWGVGIGNGILKYAAGDKTIVPKAVHDFVAIPMVYELGIVALLIIGLGYFILLDKTLPGNRLLSFPHILAAGISIALAVQGFYNLSGVFLLLPATGIPLPMISYGGSAVFANYILVGLLLSILNNQRETAHEK